MTHDTMTHDENTLQAAIDAAFQTNGNDNGNNLVTLNTTVYWPSESPARLAVAKAFLAALPPASRTSRESAIAAMEAVPCEELKKLYWSRYRLVKTEDALNRVRARLIQAAREATPGEDWQARAKKAEVKLEQTQKHLIDANRGAQRNAHANRSLANKLNEALKRAEKAEAELVDMRESLETKERVHRQDSEDLEKRLYAAEAQLSLSRLRPLAEALYRR